MVYNYKIALSVTLKGDAVFDCKNIISQKGTQTQLQIFFIWQKLAISLKKRSFVSQKRDVIHEN